MSTPETIPDILPESPYDVVVVGGGPAGLQAALTLGRVHRRALLLDSGVYRNDPAEAMHNVLGQDGRRPADLRADGRGELAAYPSVDVRDASVERITEEDGGFVATTADGAVRARRMVLATGLRDTLPAVPGLAELFGTVAAHCPFCHGHEYAGRPVAILGAADHASRLVGIMAPVASELHVVEPDDVAHLARRGEGAVLTRTDGSELEVGGIIVATTFAQAAPFAEQLGLDLLGSGCVAIDAMGRTSRPGVYAAGDLAHTAALPMPMSSVVGAMAAGQTAASGCVMDELAVPA